MLPETFKIEYSTSNIPSKTYKIDWENGTIGGFIDGKEAVQQAVELALTTERYIWSIYSWNYGSEIHTLFGKSDAFAMSEIELMIKDALSVDPRIKDVTDFTFYVNRGVITTQFTVNSTVGDISATI